MSLIDYNNHRAMIEKLYEDTATIQRYDGNYKDPRTGITSGAWVTVAEGEKCYLDIRSHGPAEIGEIVSTVAQTAILLIRPELNIPEGSRIIVNKKGVERTFKASGYPRVEGSHQEIPLEMIADV